MNKMEKAKQRYGLVLALTDLPTHLKAQVGKPGDLREGSSLKATLQRET